MYGEVTSQYSHITAKRAMNILSRREVVLSMHTALPPVYTTVLINKFLDSKELLTYTRFYRGKLEIRNNFHMRFQADDPDSLVAITGKGRSPHILRFQKEQPYLYEQLTTFFSLNPSKKVSGDIKTWPNAIKKMIYKAYTIMLAYPEVKSNRTLFE